MIVQVDTREHVKEYKRIAKQFDSLGVKHIRSKLYVGDYVNIENPFVVVDRKKGLLEVVQNVCQDHERFRKELLRAKDIGIRVIVLAEFKSHCPSCIEDVNRWVNPRLMVSPQAMSGPRLYRVMATMQAKYPVEFRFCLEYETGQKIVEMLS